MELNKKLLGEKTVCARARECVFGGEKAKEGKKKKIEDC